VSVTDPPADLPGDRSVALRPRGCHAIWAHSSLKVTTDIYGHWKRAERKFRQPRMEGTFPV